MSESQTTMWQPRKEAPPTDEEIIGYQPVVGNPDLDEQPFHTGPTTGNFLRSGGWAACTHWMPWEHPHA